LSRSKAKILPSPHPVIARLLLMIFPQNTASVVGMEAICLKPLMMSNFFTVLSADPVTMKELREVSKKLMAP